MKPLGALVYNDNKPHIATCVVTASGKEDVPFMKVPVSILTDTSSYLVKL